MSSICCAGMGCESCVRGAVIAAPAAAQLDADLPPLTDEQVLDAIGSITHEAPKRLPPGWLKFARAIEAKVVAPYAERIRQLEVAYDAATHLAGDTINARNAEVAEQNERIRLLERELAERSAASEPDPLERACEILRAFPGDLRTRAKKPAQTIDTPEFEDLVARVGRGEAKLCHLVAYIDGRTAVPAQSTEKPACRMQGGICSCHSGGSFGGCAIERGIVQRGFISEVGGRTAGTAPEGWKPLHQTYYGVEGWRDIEEHAVDEHKSMGFEVRTVYVAAAPSLSGTEEAK